MIFKTGQISAKHFWTQFLFCTKIKSTYKIVLQNTKFLDLSVKQGSQCQILLLAPRQKWVDFPPTFFELFINYLVVWYLLLNNQKILLYGFSVSAKYGPFSLWTWSKIQNFHFYYKTWIICFFKWIFFVSWKISKFSILDHV